MYYQCNVKLCIKHAGGCDQVPPVCEDGVNIVRKKRQVVELDERNNDEYELVEREETIKLYSGLYVNEPSDLEDDEFADSLDQPDVSVYDPNTFCISQRSFAIGIAIAGLILMSAVVVAIMILVSKRRRKNLSTTGSSIYSGPYTNTAYSHSSMSRFGSSSCEINHSYIHHWIFSGGVESKMSGMKNVETSIEFSAHPHQRLDLLPCDSSGSNHNWVILLWHIAKMVVKTHVLPISVSEVSLPL